MKALFLALIPASALALTPADIKADKKVGDLDSIKFCVKLGPAVRGKDEIFRAAMLRRAARSEGITNAMQGAINVRQPVLGMNLCAVLAAFGHPTRANRSVTRYGEDWQFVYEQPRRYIYLVNDKVTAWQD